MEKTTYRLTKQRIKRAAEYVDEHTYHDNSGNPIVPVANETPDDVGATLTRIYGYPDSNNSESTWWRIDDAGARLGLALKNLYDEEDEEHTGSEA